MAGYGKGGKGNGYGKGNHHQYDVNDMHLQAASGKIPPSWSPERAKFYTLLQYEQDLRIWAASSDVDLLRMGPLVALRLGGSAKVLAREMDVAMLSGGIDIPDPAVQGAFRHISGCEFILRQLQRRFAPLAEEVQISCCNDLFKFSRWSGESIDEVISRFELTVNRCENVGQLAINYVIQAWMLLNIAGIPRDKWPIILSPTLGALPGNDLQYNAFVQYIRRNGHLYENSKGEGIAQNFFSAAGDVTGETEYAFHAGQEAFSSSSWNEEWPDDASASSGESHASEPIDLSELTSIPPEQQGEYLYLGYRTAKRKFRHFSKQPGRGRKGKGKGKGKKGSGGKSGKPAFYYDETSQSFVAFESDVHAPPAYAFQKGGKPSVRKGNPVGADGKIMQCSLCHSEEHFVRFCPKNTSKGGKGGTYLALPVPEPHWSTQSGARPGSSGPSSQMYFGSVVRETFTASISYADGTNEQLKSTDEIINQQRVPPSEAPIIGSSASSIVAVPYNTLTASQQRMWQFPWWESSPNYHSTVKLPSGREGLLIDCGAIGNMCGDKIAARMEAAGLVVGQGTSWKDIAPISIGGVGKGDQEVRHEATLPVCLVDGTMGQYKAIVVEDSELPALYGLVGLTAQAAVIDCGNDRLIYPGPGGIKYNLSPGSKVIKLERAKSGHLLAPCSEWDKAKFDKSKGGHLSLF